MIVNRKLHFNYNVSRKWDAGLSLYGTEVSCLRRGMGSIVNSYAIVEGMEVFLLNMHIPKSMFSVLNHDETRRRKLLLNKREIKQMIRSKEKHFTIIPEKVYENKRGYFKITIALCEGKQKFDKRRAIKERERRLGL